MKQPALTPVDSENLAAVAYTPQALWVKFRSGPVGTYEGVPKDIFDSMMAAPRPGKYFYRFIRSAYPYTPVP